MAYLKIYRLFPPFKASFFRVMQKNLRKNCDLLFWWKKIWWNRFYAKLTINVKNRITLWAPKYGSSICRMNTIPPNLIVRKFLLFIDCWNLSLIAHVFCTDTHKRNRLNKNLPFIQGLILIAQFPFLLHSNNTIANVNQGCIFY